MIALPKHSPCGLDGAGELLPGSIDARCDVVITFRRVERRGKEDIVADKAKGCGAVSSVCRACGLRAKWDDGPCGACEKRA